MKIGMLTSLCIMLTMSCNNSTPKGIFSTKGVIKDFSGLDGCQWVIELSDNSRFIPVKWHNENYLPQNNQKIRFSYRKEPVMNTCMAGETVEIISLTEVN